MGRFLQADVLIEELVAQFGKELAGVAMVITAPKRQAAPQLVAASVRGVPGRHLQSHGERYAHHQ